VSKKNVRNEGKRDALMNSLKERERYWHCWNYLKVLIIKIKINNKKPRKEKVWISKKT
jgi:hypothetical protein